MDFLLVQLHFTIRHKELDENSVIKKYLITAKDGKKYDTNHYNLQMIIAVGFKVNNERAVQNKLHYSVHGQTAAEVIYYRADAKKENMGLTSWDGSPKGKIHKSDVAVAKNYLEVLKDSGKITKELAKLHAETEFEKYRIVQDRLYESDFDRFLGEEGV